ncbi:hypothetical protein GON01_06910 [Sphingomonas sp. MAH-20]|uniref:Right handed beta helix domain-containing protein n=1 Tax=Sphingomonas horti TaxID=2682842 RepID=A0A6I4J063_9SPHN|nr:MULTISPECIES: right-handed parallel beta-helix repeat-containing protein [Sphingomonas]MBA2920728.1 right-handed parallel beta-helix repeat-containing protein [Sphingomonas sp. CGMCC 1.13658]MVO77664.1 hypothetical protein [Sphingomonas horti]
MTIINVSNSAQFQAALGRAVGGDTIVLAGGNYGSGWISNKDFSANVTIKSASLNNRAHFDNLQVTGSSNLRFEGLDIGHSASSRDSASTIYARVGASDNIKMVGITFHGSADHNPRNDGMGLVVSGADNFQLIGSSFRDLNRGASIEKVTDVTVASNSFQDIRSDGLNFGAVTGAVIDKNSFTNFHPQAGDHADAIQFWLVNQSQGSSNIKITNNVIMQGTGGGMQGIFLSDQRAFEYKDVLIQNNLVYVNDAYHGIFVNGGRNVQVIGNTLLSKSTDHKMLWIDLNSGTNFTVKDNLADTILVQPEATGVTMSHNASLAQMAGIRALIPNLNAPKSAHDLIIADYGYHVPGTGQPGPAPVATVLGQSIGSMVDSGSANATSAQVTKTAIASPTSVLPAMEEVFLVAAHHGLAPATATAAHFAPSLPLYQVHMDHFVALP